MLSRNVGVVLAKEVCPVTTSFWSASEPMNTLPSSARASMRLPANAMPLLSPRRGTQLVGPDVALPTEVSCARIRVSAILCTFLYVYHGWWAGGEGSYSFTVLGEWGSGRRRGGEKPLGIRLPERRRDGQGMIYSITSRKSSNASRRGTLTTASPGNWSLLNSMSTSPDIKSLYSLA